MLVNRYWAGESRQHVNWRKYKEDVLQFESLSAKLVLTNRDGVELSPRLLHGALGLCTEAAEFLDSLKKRIFYGAEHDRTNQIEELGDVLWYVALLCDELHVSLPEVLEANFNKLSERYRRRAFEAQNAKVRDLERERAALEGTIGGAGNDAEAWAGGGDPSDEAARPVRDGTCG